MVYPGNKGLGKARQWLVEHQSHDNDDCLMWPFAKARGYGTFEYLGERQYAHRYMCELANGPANDNALQAAHSCGRGHLGCVNPKHLSWKTPSQNQMDRHLHGTTIRNHDGKQGRVTPEQREAMFILQKHMTHDKIAKLFGFSRQNVSAILNGKSFKEDYRRIQAGSIFLAKGETK